MLPLTPASIVDKALAFDAGAITLLLLMLGIVLAVIWALRVRDPSVNRKKYR